MRSILFLVGIFLLVRVDAQCLGQLCGAGQPACCANHLCSASSLRCALAPGQGCTSDADCWSGDCLINLVCASCGPGAPCPAGSFCSGGSCIPGCNSDSQCDAATQYCNLGTNLCTRCNAYEGFCQRNSYCCNDRCLGDSTCGCTSNTDCFGRLDGTTTCNTVTGKCVQCINDASCPLDKWCDPNSQCANCRTIGGTCSRNAQCCSDRCENGQCACQSDGDCPGQFCRTSTGVCVNCLVDTDCNANQYCSFGGAGNCESCRFFNSTCNRNAQCCTDICLNGACRQCLNNADCPSGQVCSVNNICINTPSPTSAPTSAPTRAPTISCVQSGACLPGSSTQNCCPPDPNLCQSSRTCVDFGGSFACNITSFCTGGQVCNGAGACVNTPAPTVPTKAPTAAPTSAPTNAPTTPAPTSAPTNAPTQVPGCIEVGNTCTIFDECCSPNLDCQIIDCNIGICTETGISACVNGTVCDGNGTCINTAAPTNAPTSLPTPAPTMATNAPTSAPTMATNAPTSAPTMATNAPTSAPTMATNAPTSAPTMATNAPTMATNAPTSAPTQTPPPTDPCYFPGEMCVDSNGNQDGPCCNEGTLCTQTSCVITGGEGVCLLNQCPFGTSCNTTTGSCDTTPPPTNAPTMATNAPTSAPTLQCYPPGQACLNPAIPCCDDLVNCRNVSCGPVGPFTPDTACNVYTSYCPMGTQCSSSGDGSCIVVTPPPTVACIPEGNICEGSSAPCCNITAECKIGFCWERKGVCKTECYCKEDETCDGAGNCIGTQPPPPTVAPDCLWYGETCSPTIPCCNDTANCLIGHCFEKKNRCDMDSYCKADEACNGAGLCVSVPTNAPTTAPPTDVPTCYSPGSSCSEDDLIECCGDAMKCILGFCSGRGKVCRQANLCTDTQTCDNNGTCVNLPPSSTGAPTKNGGNPGKGHNKNPKEDDDDEDHQGTFDGTGDFNARQSVGNTFQFVVIPPLIVFIALLLIVFVCILTIRARRSKKSEYHSL